MAVTLKEAASLGAWNAQKVNVDRRTWIIRWRRPGEQAWNHFRMENTSTEEANRMLRKWRLAAALTALNAPAKCYRKGRQMIDSGHWWTTALKHAWRLTHNSHRRYLISKLGKDILAQLAQRDDWTPSADLVFGTGPRLRGIDWLSYYSRMPSPGLVERRRSPVQLEQVAKGERTRARYEYRITAAGKAALASGRYRLKGKRDGTIRQGI